MIKECRKPIKTLVLAVVFTVISFLFCSVNVCADISGDNGKTIPAATVNISVKHYITGDSYTRNDSFEFMLAGKDDETPMPEDSDGKYKKVTTTADESPDFGDIVLEYPGTYYYAVSRIDKEYDNLETDNRVFTVMIAKFNDGSTDMVIMNDAGEKEDEVSYNDVFRAPRNSPKTGDEDFRKDILGWLVICTGAALILVVILVSRLLHESIHFE